MQVFVLIFNAGTDNEGIHTVRLANASGEVRNKIMLFASEDDAIRYALMLEAQDFPSPSVEKLHVQEIQDFCQEAGYDWEIIPQDGSLTIPPEINVEKPDWQPEDEPQTIEDTEVENMRRRLEGLL